MYNAAVKKITITGASGVGKTVLADKLATALNIPLLQETARLVCSEMGYERIGDIPDQEGFKRDVLEKQIALEAAHSSFVADRSAIDVWILWQRWNICSAMTYDTEFIYNKVQQHAKTYTHIIHIPPLFEPTEDGFRWTEPDYIKQIDRITRMTLFDLGVNDRTFSVSSNVPEQRVQEVLQWLESTT